MRSRSRSNAYIGAGCIVVSLATIFLWVPLDTDTGLVERVRRQLVIGDALAPMVAAGFLLLGGGLLCIVERHSADQRRITRANLRFVLALLGLVIISLALIRWAGPGVVGVYSEVSGSGVGYRELRDDSPWKYIGFFSGGTVLVAGLIGLIERRVSRRGVLVAFLAILIMSAVYDLPFDDLLLPPNGDV